MSGLDLSWEQSKEKKVLFSLLSSSSSLLSQSTIAILVNGWPHNLCVSSKPAFFPSLCFTSCQFKVLRVSLTEEHRATRFVDHTDTIHDLSVTHQGPDVQFLVKPGHHGTTKPDGWICTILAPVVTITYYQCRACLKPKCNESKPKNVVHFLSNMYIKCHEENFRMQGLL